jgi:hypothetical protein
VKRTKRTWRFHPANNKLSQQTQSRRNFGRLSFLPDWAYSTTIARGRQRTEQKAVYRISRNDITRQLRTDLTRQRAPTPLRNFSLWFGGGLPSAGGWRAFAARGTTDWTLQRANAPGTPRSPPADQLSPNPQCRLPLYCCTTCEPPTNNTCTIVTPE